MTAKLLGILGEDIRLLHVPWHYGTKVRMVF